jgi:DNA-binding response OmpR family regulator
MPERHAIILVVDDDRAVRDTTSRALVLGGYDVLQADDGIHALELLHQPDHPPIQLVVTDIVMPGLRGDDLGRLLHRTHPGLPVLYMSGFSMPDLDFLSSAELPRCWLEKPFGFDALLAKVQALLNESNRLVSM